MKKEQITVTNNSVCNSAENKGLEGKGMKRRLLHFKKRMVPAVSGALMGVMLMSTTCFAAGDRYPGNNRTGIFRGRTDGVSVWSRGI